MIRIVADEKEYIIIEKPPLVDSQNSKPRRTSVVDWLQARYGYAGLIHRLDFGASGLMVCAKTPACAAALTKEMQAGRIQKKYTAILFGKLKEKNGIINVPLDEKGGEKGNKKEAVTRYRVVEFFPNTTLVDVEIKTGRKHQIRRHFAGLGFPLIGDTLYGKKGSDRLFLRPALHASLLVVYDKTYESPLPKDMQDVIEKWRRLV